MKAIEVDCLLVLVGCVAGLRAHHICWGLYPLSSPSFSRIMDTALSRYDEPLILQHIPPRPTKNRTQWHSYITPRQHMADSKECWLNNIKSVLKIVVKIMDTALSRYDELLNLQHNPPRPTKDRPQWHSYLTPIQNMANLTECWLNTTSKLSSTRKEI